MCQEGVKWCKDGNSNVSKYAIKVSDGFRKILYRVRKVSDGAMKVSKCERTIDNLWSRGKPGVSTNLV